MTNEEKMNLRLYYREVIVYDYQGKYHKAVYVPQFQYVLTDNIEPFNKRKKIKFREVAMEYTLDKINELIAKYDINQVNEYTEQLSDQEIHWRKSASKYRK